MLVLVLCARRNTACGAIIIKTIKMGFIWICMNSSQRKEIGSRRHRNTNVRVQQMLPIENEDICMIDIELVSMCACVNIVFSLCSSFIVGRRPLLGVDRLCAKHERGNILVRISFCTWIPSTHAIQLNAIAIVGSYALHTMHEQYLLGIGRQRQTTMTSNQMNWI